MPHYPVYKGRLIEPDDQSKNTTEKNIQEQPTVEARPIVTLKREESLKEFLNVLVNGDEISQLFINSELTEKAKEELIKLQEEAANSAKINMQNLRESISELQKAKQELDDNIARLEMEKYSLNEEVETLKKRKMLLTQAMISDLSLMKQAVQDEYNFSLSNTYSWKWDIKEWKNLYGNVNWADKPVSEIPLLFEEKFKEYAEKMNCSLEEAKMVFYNICPGVKYVLDYIENIKDEETLNKYFKEIRDCNPELLKSYQSIYYPEYEIVNTKSKTL